MRKLKKPLLIILSILVLVVVLIIVFISPITKYLVEKYDEEYTGRQITMDWAYVNPFTGYIHFNDFKIYESKNLPAYLEGDSIFFSTNGVSVNIAMLKLLSKTYEITDFTLNKPRGIVIQNKKDFNFNDLIEKFSSKEPVDTTSPPVHFNVLTINIKDGEFHYHENVIPINYFIKKVNFESSGMRWDVDTIAGNFSFLSGMGSGEIKGNFTMNIKNDDYRTAVIIKKFDLQIIEQYMKDLANYGSLRAFLDADIKATGNLNNQEDLMAVGKLAINDFHFGKNPKNDFASFDRLAVGIQELSPLNRKYMFDSITLSHPYFKYEIYDYLDNIQTMFGKDGANISEAQADPAKFNLILEIADYVKVLAKNFFQSYYRINRIAVYNGDIKVNDYSTTEKFTVSLEPLSFTADSIDKDNARANLFLNSGIKPYGDASISLSINPKDTSDFDLHYKIEKLPATLFNPYTITYTSFPLDRGTIEFKGDWKVRNGNIDSENRLTVLDPRVSKRIRNKDTKWIPMPLVMAFVRERGNAIDYEIPIKGNLCDPKFRIGDVISDLFKNIFVKPVTTPYRMQVKSIETEIEKLLTLKWEMMNSDLKHKQEEFIEKIAEFLKDNRNASISIHPQQYAIKEKEYILFFEAKKKYFISTNNKDAQSFTEEDSTTVNKMSVKDSSFVRYLNKHINDSLLFTIQEKCDRFIDNAVVNAKFQKLMKEREKVFVSYFVNEGVEKQVKINAGKNVVPFNGFSFYEIQYKGEFPESLLKAYRKMNDLDDEAPRKKFKNERKKYKRT